MRKQTNHRAFFRFGDFANEHVGTSRDKERWCVDGAGRINSRIILAIPEGDVAEISDWDKEFVVKAQQKSRIQDMPCTLAYRPVVSDRLRKLIESVSPGSAQYLPLRITWGGKQVNGQYWVANWLRALDCVDWRRSVPRLKPPPPDPVVFEELALNPNRIPRDVHVFVVRHAVHTVLCSETLRSAIDEAGMTGCQYLELP